MKFISNSYAKCSIKQVDINQNSININKNGIGNINVNIKCVNIFEFYRILEFYICAYLRSRVIIVIIKFY